VCLGLTRIIRTASRTPRKGRTSDDPGRLPSSRDILACFRNEDPCARARLGGFARSRAHRFAFVESRRPCQYLRAIPRFGTAIQLGLGRVSQLVLRLAKAHDQRCVRSMSATQHSTNEHPYSSAPGSSSEPQVALPLCVRLTGLRPSGPRNRAFHDARLALEDRPLSWGIVRPVRERPALTAATTHR